MFFKNEVLNEIGLLSAFFPCYCFVWHCSPVGSVGSVINLDSVSVLCVCVGGCNCVNEGWWCGCDSRSVGLCSHV